MKLPLWLYSFVQVSMGKHRYPSERELWDRVYRDELMHSFISAAEYMSPEQVEREAQRAADRLSPDPKRRAAGRYEETGA